MAVARPAVRLLKISAAVILRGFDIPLTERAQVHSPEELKLIATAARRMGLLPTFQETLIHRALELDDVPIREIMTPRQKIFSLPSNMLIEEASAKVIDRQHSRVPVYDETRGPEHIVGVVYSKDLARLMFFRTAPERIPIRPLAAGCLRLRQSRPERSRIPDQPRTSPLPLSNSASARSCAMCWWLPRPSPFSTSSATSSIAAATWPSWSTSTAPRSAWSPPRTPSSSSPASWKTSSTRPPPVLTTASGALLMDGGVNLRDLETQMQWRLPRDGGVETLAGFLLMRLGHIPQAGESIVYEGRRLTVVEMDGRRIAKIRVEPADQTQEIHPQ